MLEQNLPPRNLLHELVDGALSADVDGQMESNAVQFDSVQNTRACSQTQRLCMFGHFVPDESTHRDTGACMCHKAGCRWDPLKK